MKPSFLLALVSCSLFCNFLSGEGITGFWKTLDDDTKKTSSIIAIYPFEDAYYGRIIITYDDEGKVDNTIYEQKSRETELVGDPFLAGLDLIWGLKKEGEIYKHGEILDPKRGKIYKAEAWTEGDQLVVRGEVLIFGRNEIWPKAKDEDFPAGFIRPDLTTLTPSIPKLK